MNTLAWSLRGLERRGSSRGYEHLLHADRLAENRLLYARGGILITERFIQVISRANVLDGGSKTVQFWDVSSSDVICISRLTGCCWAEGVQCAPSCASRCLPCIFGPVRRALLISSGGKSLRVAPLRRDFETVRNLIGARVVAEKARVTAPANHDPHQLSADTKPTSGMSSLSDVRIAVKLAASEPWHEPTGSPKSRTSAPHSTSWTARACE